MSRTYRILSPVDWDGTRHEIGAIVDMPDGVARQLVELGAVARHDKIPPRGEGGGAAPRPDPPGGSGAPAGEALSEGDDPPPAPGAGGGEPPSPDTAPSRAVGKGGGAEASPPDSPAELHAAIVAAIDQVPADGRTRTGAPKVGALERVLGFGVTGAERDAAWAAYQART